MGAVQQTSAPTTWLSFNVPRMIVGLGTASRYGVTMSVQNRPEAVIHTVFKLKTFGPETEIDEA